MTNAIQQPSRRPVWIWVISVFYLLSAGYTLLSFAWIHSGAVKLNAAQEAYFASLTSVDWFFTLSIGVIGIAGAISLFLLRRLSVTLFSISLALNLAFTAFHMMRTNWIEALGGAGLFGILIGWVILVAVILYARHLMKRGVLH
jgi:hypothetical protein